MIYKRSEEAIMLMPDAVSSSIIRVFLAFLPHWTPFRYDRERTLHQDVLLRCRRLNIWLALVIERKI